MTIRIKIALALGAALALMPLVSQAQYAGSNVTGRAGLIAIDKIGNRIRFYDPATLAETKAVEPPGKAVHELTVSYDHKTAYAPLYGDGIYGSNAEPNNKIVIIDLAKQAIADVMDLGEFKAPHGMVATKGGKLWVVCDLEHRLLLIDPVAKKIEATYDIPAKGPHFIAMLPDESKLYASAKEGPLTVFDTKARMVTAQISLARAGVTAGNGSGSEGLAPTPDGARVVVVDNDRGDLRVIDARTDKEIDRVPLVGAPFTNMKRSRLVKLMFSPDGRYLVAVGYAEGTGWVIDGRDYRKQVAFAVAKGPQGIAFAPDGKTALVSSHDEGLITKVDLATGKAVAAYDGGQGIENLAYY